MTVQGIKHISEYNRQYKWHDAPAPRVEIAGVPSYKELKTSEPALQDLQRPTLELARCEELEEPVKPLGSPSKELHITRDPPFTRKKRVPGSSPERPKVDKALAKKAGILAAANTARYQSEYARTFSPKKGAQAGPPSPRQSAKSMFIDSKTNLPIGKKPVEKKMQSEYSLRYADPTAELKNIRKVYQEQMRRKQLELDLKVAEEKAADIPPLEAVPVKEAAQRAPEPLEHVPIPHVEHVPIPHVEHVPIPQQPPQQPQQPAKPPPAEPKKVDQARRLKLKVVNPLRGDKPKVKATYDIISPQKPAKTYWQTEYNAKYEVPEKPCFTPSAYGKRAHPYKNASPEKVAELLKPDKSEIICTDELNNSGVWYNQVLELRTLAEKYKAKSHGSHFSPNNMVHLAYSSAQLRDVPSALSTSASYESVKIIPQTPKSPKHKPRTVETDIKLTDLEVEEDPPKPPSPPPNIAHLIQKVTPPPRSPKLKPTSPKRQTTPPKPRTPEKAAAAPVKVVAIEEGPKIERVLSAASTPRSASRSCTLLADRVPTPQLRNMGSRHHLDRTTRPVKANAPPQHNTILAGRCETPRLHQIGGYRHHLDGTTPSASMTKPAPTPAALGTQPFQPLLNGEVSGKLDFSTPAKAEAWAADLDTSVLSRASSCTSLASATLQKAKGRTTNFWR